MYRKGEVTYQALPQPDRVQMPDDRALLAAEPFRDYIKNAIPCGTTPAVQCQRRSLDQVMKVFW